jgi:hypothetical protein
MKINDGFRTVQAGEETGPLKEIRITDDAARCTITFLAENRNDPDEVETAIVYLTRGDRERFVEMLQSKFGLARARAETMDSLGANEPLER